MSKRSCPIDEGQIHRKLKKIALEKWPDTIDGIVDQNQTVSTYDWQITATAKAIQYYSSVDRAALHHINDNLVASLTQLVALVVAANNWIGAWRKLIRDATVIVAPSAVCAARVCNDRLAYSGT